MKGSRLLVILLAAALVGCAAPAAAPVLAPTDQPLPTERPTVIAAPADTFQNPVLKTDFPDPSLLKAGDTYYAYATNASGKHVQVARSQDLVSWEVLSDAMPALAKWIKLNSPDVLAPEAIQIGDQYMLYYTARDTASGKQCVGVATSAKPAGKFKDTRDTPLVCQTDEGGTIDPSPFRDGEKLYLYYKNDGNCCGMATYIYAQELAPDGLSLIGEPVRLVRNDQPWEGNVIEAPTMVKHDGQYTLFFSANNYASVEYAVGYAACATATGPCQDAPENPILSSQMKEQPFVIGPGHQTVVQIGDQTWIVYHAWEFVGGRRGDRRLMWIDRLDWIDGRPIVRGPTTGP